MSDFIGDGKEMQVTNSAEDLCAHCGGPKELRNPTGNCDHMYWPDLLTDEAKRANGYHRQRRTVWSK